MPRVMALNSFSNDASRASPMRRPPEPVTRTPHSASAGSDRQQFLDQRLRGVGRAALDAPVGGDQQGPVFHHADAVGGLLEECRVSGEKLCVEVLVLRLAHERGLETDTTDVDAQRSGHRWKTIPPPRVCRVADSEAYRPTLDGRKRVPL